MTVSTAGAAGVGTFGAEAAGETEQNEAEEAGAEPADARRPTGRGIWYRGPIALLCLAIVLVLLAATLSGWLLHRSLLHGLDGQLRSASDRYAALMDDPSDNDHDADDDFDRMVGPVTGTLGVVVAGGQLQSVALLGHGSTIPAPAGGRLISLHPATGLQSVRLPGLGSYRLAVRGNAGRFEVVGLPLGPEHRLLTGLLAGEAALAVLILALLAGLLLRPRRRPDQAAGSLDEARVQALLAEASHELRTPAAVIHSYAEMAEQSSAGLPPSVDRALQRIESESARMGRMVEDLLVLSRFEGGYRPQLTEVDLTKLVLDAVDDARVADRQDRWELIVPDRPVAVLGNARWLFQAVAAMLSNVRAHTPPGSTVRITLRSVAGQAELAIADNGPGIPPDILSGVFDRFVRSDDSARYDGKIGVGLGLSVVSQIVQAHSGSISVDSSSAGTEFVLRLPLAANS